MWSPGIRTRWMAFAVALPLLAVACSGDTQADIEVTLSDSAIELSPATTASGEITLAATNDGTTTHEFEVFAIQGDVDPASLPVDDNVADTEGLSLIDEVEDVTPGGGAELTIDLDPGSYAIICNLPGHYAQGMHATFTVE